jgi:hypothetical protein
MTFVNSTSMYFLLQNSTESECNMGHFVVIHNGLRDSEKSYLLLIGTTNMLTYFTGCLTRDCSQTSGTEQDQIMHLCAFPSPRKMCSNF